MRCSDHCPPEADGVLAVVAIGAGAVVLAAVALLLADILAAVAVVLAVAIAGGVVLLVTLTRHGGDVIMPEARAVIATVTAGQRQALGAPKLAQRVAPTRHQVTAASAARPVEAPVVHVITDARPREVAGAFPHATRPARH